ncbi:hypothetical protein ACN6KK_08780 [Enterococcus faecium]
MENEDFLGDHDGFDVKTTFYETKDVFYFFSIKFVVEVRMR